MFQVTSEVQWLDGVQHAEQFLEPMWDDVRHVYLAGTTDPETRNELPGQLPRDAQAWSVLVIPSTLVLHPEVLASAESNHRTRADGFSGFDFNEDRDGVWFERTGQMAVAYAAAGIAPAASALRV